MVIINIKIGFREYNLLESATGKIYILFIESGGYKNVSNQGS